jgi:hypothetical protein
MSLSLGGRVIMSLSLPQWRFDCVSDSCTWLCLCLLYSVGVIMSQSLAQWRCEYYVSVSCAVEV